MADGMSFGDAAAAQYGYGTPDFNAARNAEIAQAQAKPNLPAAPTNNTTGTATKRACNVAITQPQGHALIYVPESSSCAGRGFFCAC